MGANVSKTSKTVDVKTLNKSVSDFLTRNSQTLSNSATSTQTIDVEFRKDLINCNVDVSNKNISTQAAMGTLNVNQMSELANKVETELNDMLKKRANQKNGLFSLGSNVSVTDSKTKSSVENVCEKTFTIDNMTNIQNQLFNVQDTKLIFYGNVNCKGNDLTISNDFLSHQIASILIDTLQTNIEDNKVLNEVTSTLDEKIDQSNGLILTGGFSFLLLFLCCICSSIIMAALMMNRKKIAAVATKEFSTSNSIGAPVAATVVKGFPAVK